MMLPGTLVRLKHDIESVGLARTSRARYEPDKRWNSGHLRQSSIAIIVAVDPTNNGDAVCILTSPSALGWLHRDWLEVIDGALT